MRKKILNLCKLQLFSKETEELTRFVYCNKETHSKLNLKEVTEVYLSSDAATEPALLQL